MSDEKNDKISAEHQKIYDHLGECKDEMIEHMDNTLLDHINTSHHDLIHLQTPFEELFPGESADSVMLKLALMADQFPKLLNVMLGTEKDVIFGGGRFNDGFVHKLETITTNQRGIDHKVDVLYQKLGNGEKLETKMSWGDRGWQTVLLVVVGAIAKVFGWI